MLTVGLVTLFACGDSTPEPAEPAPAARPTPPVAAKATQTPDVTRRGKVLEAIDTEGYTYVRMDYCGQEAWVAGPKTALPVGAIVKMPEGIVSTNFESKALGRTLEALLMVDWFEVTEETTIDCPTVAAAEPKEAAKPALHGQVVETMQSGGYTYAKVESCGTESWLAGPQTFLRDGHFVQVAEVAEMRGFSSKTLGRTFESILFVPGFKIVPEGPECE